MLAAGDRSHSVATTQDMNPGLLGRDPTRVVWKLLAGVALACATAASAVIVKEFRSAAYPLAAVDVVSVSDNRPVGDEPKIVPVAMTSEPVETEDAATEPDALSGMDEATIKLAQDPEIRWFNGRPVRPAKHFWMTVTGYSPDERSCAGTADGLTATLHSVETNNFKLVAADTRLLPYGSMVTVPGYDDSRIVPVLDCEGAIKGRRLDCLFPTHEQAREWGRQKLLVTVWEYADGKPAENPRKLR